MLKEIICINDSNFESEVIASDKPVLVDFGASWCGPCSRQLPILQEYIKNNDNIKVCKIDIDDCPNLTKKYNIRSVPTLILFNKGKSVWVKTGLMTMAILESAINIIE